MIIVYNSTIKKGKGVCLKQLFYFCIFLLCASLNAQWINDVKVVKVADGDTITVLTNENEQIRVRLYGIDAPESSQDFGSAARKVLSGAVAGKTVSVDVKDTDRYGRSVGVVYVGNSDVNEFMVSNGYAWAYRRFTDVYVNKEAEAKNKKLGLWSQSGSIPPWDYRKQQRAIKDIDVDNRPSQKEEGISDKVLRWFGF